MPTTTKLRAAMLALVLLSAPGLAAAQSLALPDAMAQAGRLLDDGKFADAEALAKQIVGALAADAEAGKETAEAVGALNTLAYAIAGQGKLKEALPLMERIAAARSRLLGAGHPDVAQALNDQGALLQQLGEFAKAEAVHAQALAIREKALPRSEGQVAQSLNNLAQMKKKLGKTDEVEPLLRQAAAAQEKALGPNSADLGDTLADIADLLADEGREDEAVPLAERALSITEKALGPDDPEVARRFIKLANVLSAQRKFADAEASFRKALTIREKAFGADSRQAAGVLSNLADAVLSQDRAADAEPLLRRALDLQTKLRGPGHPSVGTTQRRLANSLKGQGRLEEAEPLYGTALAILENVFGADHPDVAETLFDSADLAFKRGKFDDAFNLLKRASAIFEKRASVGDTSLEAGALVTRKQGEIFRRFAETGFELALTDESRRVLIATDTFKAAQLAGQSRTGVALNQLGVRIGQSDPALAETVRQRQDLSAKWLQLEGALIDALGTPAGGTGGGTGQGAGKNKQDAASGAGAILAAMTKAEGEIAAIDAKLTAASPTYAELSNPRPLTIGEAQKALAADEAMVLYLVNADNTLIWVWTREQIVFVNTQAGEARLTGLVKTLRAGLDTPEAKEAAVAGKAVFDLAAAHELYTLLLGSDRVEAALAGKKHVIIVPTGVLTALPFQVLVTAPPAGPVTDESFRKAEWLIRRHAVSVLPTVSSLKLLDRGGASTAPLPFLGIGDPVFKSGANENGARGVPGTLDTFFRGRDPSLAALSRGLAQLPETSAEINAVARALGADPASVILGADASETTLKSLSQDGTLAKYRVVEFATHGLVAGEVEAFTRVKAEPALALSLPSVRSANDDGLLTASEVAELKLDADWVVLSACNTAAGKEPGAEALSGLARSFFFAGTRALLVSHWAVNSRAAVELTTGTFEHMAKDKSLSRSEALRRQMLEIIDTSDDITHAHPNYWAPFSLVGYGGV